MKKTDKLTKKQVMAILSLVNKKNLSIGEIAKIYRVSWPAVWYWVGRLRKDGYKIKTRKKGQLKMKLNK